MERVFEALTRLLFILLAVCLFGLAIAMVVAGCWQLVSGGLGGEVGIYGLMNGVGLLIVSLAIIDVAKFVVEENVLTHRELRSQGEARRSLTKFMSIIIIALSLEAVVGIFEAGREKNYGEQVYPVAVMSVAVFALIGLGVFQFLSRRSQAEPTQGDDEV